MSTRMKKKPSLPSQSANLHMPPIDVVRDQQGQTAAIQDAVNLGLATVDRVMEVRQGFRAQRAAPVTEAVAQTTVKTPPGDAAAAAARASRRRAAAGYF